MKKVYLLLLCCLAGIASYGQTAASYTFSRTTSSFTSISGVGTPVTGGILSDDGNTSGIPIGFTFKFCGNSYTTCTGNSNGVLSLQSTGVASCCSLSTSAILGGGWLMPIWADDDGRTAGGGVPNAWYQTTGVAGSRIFTMEWNDWSIFNQNPYHMNFQVKLFEGTGIVQFCYGSRTTSQAGIIGIANSTTDYQTLPTTSSTSCNTSFNNGVTMPPSGDLLQWCPVPVIGNNTAICAGATNTLTTQVTGGVWSSSNPAIATVNPATGLVTGVAAGTTTIVYTPGCGTAANATVTVNPIPDIVASADQVVCNAASTTAVAFTGSVTGTVFNWTNSNTSIGLAGSGAGTIGSFTATDTSASAAVTSTVIITPVANGCTGTPDTFTITVNPTPNVVASPNQTLCNGATTAAVNFTGSVPGTIYTWNNDNSSIGLASTGTGNIAAFTATNTTPDPIAGVVTVMTTANGCSGSSNSFTITVEPTPMLSTALSAMVCNNTEFSYEPNSLTAGTSYSWDRAGMTGISNPGASDGGGFDETLNDTIANPVAVVYVYTLTANGCTNVQNFVLTVNPTPVLTSSLTPPAICDSTMFTYASTSATTGATYTWSRATVVGISNPANSGADTIREVLVNTTTEPVMVTYVDTLHINGCMNTQTVTVTVNPRPMLTTPLTMPAICDSALFTYVSASATTGTTFAWSRSLITGIANPAAHGGDTISEHLYNTSVNPINVIYYDTLKANGCLNVQQVMVTVNPTPKLSSSLTPPGICDSAIFNYTAMSGTLGTDFTWVRPFVLGIDKVAGSGITGNPNEQLINTTNDNLNVTYIYTLTANGCTHTQSVVVVVHPTPLLSSSLTPSVCSGELFNYSTTSYAFGTTFAWTRAKVAGLSPNTGSGTGNISETLFDSLLTPINTIYHFVLTANGCSHTQNITLTVKPKPTALEITTHPNGDVCSNTLFQNFGVASVPPAGQDYHWTAYNATVWATGSDKQYSLVNFDKPGTTAVISLKTNVTGVGCVTSNDFNVNVGTSVSEGPVQVIHFNGQLVCLRNDMDSYQWGYDDATTLDSTMIPGEHNPNYFIDVLDVAYRYYWVITTHNGCMQKSYYNMPTGLSNINSGEQAAIKLYPNPAKDVVNVEINTTAGGSYEVEVINMLGQKINKTKVTDHKAMIDVASLPAGCYLVDCYRDGIKISASRFIKN